ncbi:MAG: hypothetical protein J6M58_06010 [Clostridium sp.]|nr:hypothetical protein [Clostridium sp.]
MNSDFHYYATFCAAYLAGYTTEESRNIAWCAQFTDCCSATFLTRVRGPKEAATTQLQLELANARTDLIGLQKITRIWASFHFLPGDLTAEVSGGKFYRDKFRLICNVNSPLLKETVNLAKGNGTEAAGLAMHVLADTWAHRFFAGTPSLVINNTNYHFYELITENGGLRERKVTFRHNPSAPDDLDRGIYNNTVMRLGESAIMNLGHGRAGHLPDYSFMRYRYMPAWGNYTVVTKNNPSDYMRAFRQMVYALRCIRGAEGEFCLCRYDTGAVDPWASEIKSILTKRRPDASEDWKALGLRLSGFELPEFNISEYEQEYLSAQGDGKDDTVLGRFFMAALRQKSMVTNKIFMSGNPLAGISVDYALGGFKGVGDYRRLLKYRRKEGRL